MSHNSRFIKYLLVLLPLVSSLALSLSYAGIPTDIPAFINYEGRLTKSADGIAVTETLNMTFTIYEDVNGQTALYTQEARVYVENGLFSVVLGEIPAEVFTEHPNTYIGMKIEDNPEMRPLQQVASVAYAYKADMAKTAENVMGQVNVDPSGNVGIGTTSPENSLHVATSSSTLRLGHTTTGKGDSRIKLSDNNGARYVIQAVGGNNALTINTYNERNSESTLSSGGISIREVTGNVGIGTTDPKAKLHIKGAAESGATHLYIEDNNIQRLNLSTDSGMFFDTSLNVGHAFDGAAGIGGSRVSIASWAYGRGAQLSLGANETRVNQNFGFITFVNDESDNNKKAGAQISAMTEDPNREATSLVFATNENPSSGYPLRRMVIKSSGNVGIGTSSPTSILHLSNINPVLKLQDINATNTKEFAGQLGFYNSSDTQLGYIGYGTSTNNQLYIYNSEGDIYLNSSVGIGTMHPRGKLDIQGTSSADVLKLRNGLDGHTNPITAYNDKGTQTHYWAHNTAGDAHFVMRDTNNNSNVVLNTKGVSFFTGGNVGIGTTEPEYKLDVSGDIRATGTIYANFSATGNSYLATNSGRVGIGTTSPEAELHLKATSPDLRVETNLAEEEPSISLIKTAYKGMSIGVREVEGTGAGHRGLSINSDTQLTGTDLMFINENGNVGIGTTSPSQKLVVSTDEVTSDFKGIIVENTAGAFGVSSRAGIAFKAYDWVQGGIWHGRNITEPNGGSLVFGTNPDTKNLGVNGLIGRMVITNSGNVGIGTSTPNATLDVNDRIAVNGQQVLTVNNNDILIGDLMGGDGTRSLGLRAGDKTQMYITDSGNIGIGTTNPGSYKLAVNGISSFGNRLDIYPGGNSTRIGIIGSQGDIGPFGLNSSDLVIKAMGSFAIGTNNMNTARLTIDTSGNVGIGTAGPADKLEVAGGNIVPSGGYGLNWRDNIWGGGGDDAWIRYYQESGENTKLQIGINNDADDDLELYQAGAPRLNISNGNVGIGTTSPGAQLEVGGQVKITGGSPGAGKVLTSDSQGLGSWQSVRWPDGHYCIFRNGGSCPSGFIDDEIYLVIGGHDHDMCPGDERAGDSTFIGHGICHVKIRMCCK